MSMILLLNIDQDQHYEKPLYKELVELSLDNSVEIISDIFDLNNINNGNLISIIKLFFIKSIIDYGVGALNIALQSVTWRGSTLKSKNPLKNDLILSNPVVDREAMNNKLSACNKDKISSNIIKDDNGTKAINKAKEEEKNIEANKKEEEPMKKENKEAGTTDVNKESKLIF